MYDSHSEIFDHNSDILNSYYSSNQTLLFQTGDVISGRVKSDGAEALFPPGYIARPAQAQKEKDASQGLSLIRSDHDVIIGFKDLRDNTLQENLGFGETQIYAVGPSNSGICKIVLKNNNTDQQVLTTAGSCILEVKSNNIINLKSNQVNLGNNASLGVALGAPLQSYLNLLVIYINLLNAAIPSGVSLVNPAPSPPNSIISNSVKAST